MTVHNEGETADEKYLRENPPGEWKYSASSVKDEFNMDMKYRILIMLFNLFGFLAFYYHHAPPADDPTVETLSEYNADMFEWLKTRFVREFFTPIDRETLLLGFF